jgi:hypothetical protein
VVSLTRRQHAIEGLLASACERLFNDGWYDLLRIHEWRGLSCLSLELIRLFGPKTFP